jgi:ATP-binding cassette subfamily B protein
MPAAIRDRLRLLGLLRAAGPGLVAAVVAVALVASLVPAATALTVALLVAHKGQYARLYGIQATAYAPV